MNLPQPVREFRFATPRRWKFDFAWLEPRLAVEIEGGVFVFGGHSRGMAMTEDAEKYNIAALLGWTVLRFTVKHFQSGWVFEVVQAVLTSEAARRALVRATIGGDIQPALRLAAGEE